MSLPKYPAYKDSEVRWLGKLPEHWEIKQIKHATYLKGRVGWKGLHSDEYMEEGYSYLVTGTDFSQKFINWKNCHCIDEVRYLDDPFIQLRNGDLLITKDGTIGKLALVSGLDKPACLNSGIFLIRPISHYTTEFMYWVLSSKSFSLFCDLWSTGSTIQHLYQNVFERFSFGTPPISEQTLIAQFLDRETSKIDVLIAEQEKLISLLDEQRQAMISHAVTKGLNPDAPMKDSGVEWLGEVPEHWKLAPMNLLIKTRKGVAFKADDFAEDGVRVVRASDIKKGTINAPKIFLPTTFVGMYPNAVLSTNDIIISTVGSTPDVVNSAVGQIGKLPSDLNNSLLNQNTVVFSPFTKTLNNSFLFYFLNTMSYREHLNLHAHGTANQASLNVKDMLLFKMSIPSLLEQAAIVTYLDQQITQLDTLRIEARRGIDLLKERRSTLISAAVTGKIDVRGLVNTEAA